MAFRAKLVALLTRFRGGFRYRERIPEVDDDSTGCGRPACVAEANYGVAKARVPAPTLFGVEAF